MPVGGLPLKWDFRSAGERRGSVKSALMGNLRCGILVRAPIEWFFLGGRLETASWKSWDKMPDVGTVGAAVGFSGLDAAVVVTSERPDAGQSVG